jgi:predicted transport protein
MEQNFGHSEYSEKFDRFMRDYLTIKKGVIPKIGEVYEEFKLFSRIYSSVKELVEDIYWYSKFFVNIEFEKESDEEIRKVFSDINELKVNVSYPFIISVYNDYEKKLIAKDIFLKILRLVEAYVFRRAICGILTNSLNKTFAVLYKEIDQANYLESIMAAFALKDSYRKFPADDEFLTQVSMRDVYSLKIRNFLLDKLENNDRKELVNVDSYTIEHIMPQTLTDEWKKELGPKWEETYNHYLHTLGNITLTGYNSEYSNRPFKEKQTMEGGFKDSPIKLNRDLAVLSKWDREEITKRAKKLADLTITIWKYPYLPSEILAKYRKEAEEETQYSLEDYKNINDSSRAIYEELRKRICNLGSDVSQEFKKLYIAFKVSTNFVDLVPKKNGFDVFLNLDFSEIKDPQELCEDVSNKGHWANGNIKFKLESRKDLDYAMVLIKQAYEAMTGAENA